MTTTDGPSMTHVECGAGHLRLVPTLDMGTCPACARIAELEAKLATAEQKVEHLKARNVMRDQLSESRLELATQAEAEVARLRAKCEGLLTQNQEIAASNADHVRWHREMEATLADVMRQRDQLTQDLLAENARLAKVVQAGQTCGLAVSHGCACPALAAAK